MNKIHCPKCDTLVDFNTSSTVGSAGPGNIRFVTDCSGCGWVVSLEARSREFMIQQMTGG